MQKKLLGVAVAAALAAPTLALAQSSVQVYGTVHLSANQAKYGSDKAGTLNSETKYGVTSHASNWGLRSTESLGGGMTAWFQAEFNMKMTRDNGVPDGESTARNSGVGLRGNFGNIYLGTWETPWAQTFRFWDVGTIGGWGPTTSIIGRRESTAAGASHNCVNAPSAAGGTLTANSAAAGTIGNQLIAGANVCGNGAGAGATPGIGGGYALWRRFGYSIFYESPVWSGVQFKLAISPNEGKSNYVTAGNAAAPAAAGAAETAQKVNENPSAWSASLGWTGMGGRARAFLANMRAKDWSTPGNTDSGWTFGGGYDFGPVNLGATYEKYTYKLLTAGTIAAPTGVGDQTAKEWAIAASIPAGPGHVGISYAKANQLSGSAQGAANDTGAKMWNIGYEWTLSKRTALGFGIAKITNGQDIGYAWTGTIPSQNGFSSGVVANGQSVQNIFASIRHSF